MKLSHYLTLTLLLFICQFSHAQDIWTIDPIVKIHVPSLEENGSGLLIGWQDGMGYVLTAAHVVADPDEDDIALSKEIAVNAHIREILNGGAAAEKPTPVSVEVVLFNDKLDLAVVRFSTTSYALKHASAPEMVNTDFEDLRECNINDMAKLRGYSGGAKEAYDEIGLMIQGTRYYDDERAFRMEAEAIDPGHSGSAVFSSTGNLIGVMLQKNGTGTAAKVRKLSLVTKTLTDGGIPQNLLERSPFIGTWQLTYYWETGGQPEYFPPTGENKFVIAADGSMSGAMTGHVCVKRKHMTFNNMGPSKGLMREFMRGGYGMPIMVIEEGHNYEMEYTSYKDPLFGAESRKIVIISETAKVELTLIGY